MQFGGRGGWSLSPTLTLGGGAHNAQDKRDDQFGETEFMLLWEPAVWVETRITAERRGFLEEGMQLKFISLTVADQGTVLPFAALRRAWGPSPP